MDGIEGISGIAGGPVGAASAHASPVSRTARPPAIAQPRQTTDARAEAEAGDIAAGQVRAGGIGSDGRFEKLILAVQALRLVYGAEEHAAGPRVQEMREAAQEIFRIDGEPAPIEPATSTAQEVVFAPPEDAAEGEKSSPPPSAAPVEPAPREPASGLTDS